MVYMTDPLLPYILNSIRRAWIRTHFIKFFVMSIDPLILPNNNTSRLIRERNKSFQNTLTLLITFVSVLNICLHDASKN